MRASIAMIVFAACGSPHSLADAGAGDAGGVDGANGMAHVSVHVASGAGDGAPVAGAQVEAASAVGVIGASTVTGADGRAAIDAPSGGMIVVTENGNAKIVIAGVKDGDALEIGAPQFAIVGTASVDFPLEATALGYTVDTGCAATASDLPPFDVDLFAACAGPHTIVVVADHGAQPPSYLIAPAITLADGDAVTLTGTWAAGAAATIGVTGFPVDGDPNSLDVSRDALAGGWLASEATARPALTGGAGSVSLPAPIGAGDRQLVQVEYRRGADTVIVDEETALGDASVDVATLPDVTRTGAGTWTVAGGSAIGIYGSAQFHDDASGVTGALAFVAPPEATAIPVPAGVTIVGTTGTAVIVANSALAGYDGYRQQAAATNGLTLASQMIASDLRLAIRYF